MNDDPLSVSELPGRTINAHSDRPDPGAESILFALRDALGADTRGVFNGIRFAKTNKESERE